MFDQRSALLLLLSSQPQISPSDAASQGFRSTWGEEAEGL